MPDFELPDTRYALSGDVNIAYQTMRRARALFNFIQPWPPRARLVTCNASP
jgi:hypothetical protein